MARRFLVPLELPGDAGAALYAVPKQQLDAGIATRAAATHAATHAAGGSDPLTPQAVGAVMSTAPTATKTAAYTAQVGELVMVDASGGPITITLPVITGAGQRAAVKKVDSSANVVTVAAGAGNTIGSAGGASVPIRLQDQAVTYQASGTNWVIPHSHLGLPSLDARFVSSTRQVLPGTGLTGGGVLTSDVTLTVAYGTTSGTAAQGNDARLTDARTPTAHGASHQPGGADEVLRVVAAKTASYTLTGSDDVVVFNTASGAMTATLPTAVGRGGKRFMVKKLGGTTANPLTIATTSSQTIDGAATEVISVAGGFREVISDGTNWHLIGGKVEPVIISLASVGAGGSIAIDASVGSIYRVTTTGATATLAVPTNPIDGDSIFVDLTASVALTLTVNASILTTTGLTSSIPVAAGKKLFLNMRTIGTTWYLLAAAASA